MKRVVPVALLLAATLLLSLCGLRTNPPGLAPDEASISYNALLMSRHGVDEYGQRFPFFFRSNPVYMYSLAALFRVVPPADVVGRRLSAFLAWLTAVLIGWLAWRVSGRPWIGVVSFATAFVTPMLFEIGRLVLEAAMVPFVVALFLVAAWQAGRRERWGAGTVAALFVTLLLLTYTYSIGRLFGPLMAVGLLLFTTRARLRGMIALILLCAAVPLVLYHGRRDPLLARYDTMRSYGRQHGFARRALTVGDYLIDNLDPLALTIDGDPSPRHHVQGSGGSVLVMTALLAAIGVIVVLATRRDRWWLFVVWGALASYIPVSLTYDVRHTLRLTPLPLFLIVLSIPALELLESRPRLVGAFLAGGAIQAVWFFSIFLTAGPRRPPFDGGMKQAVEEVVATPQRPVYTVGIDAYTYASWYGALTGVPRSAFVLVKAASQVPPGATAVMPGNGWRARLLRSSDRSR